MSLSLAEANSIVSAESALALASPACNVCGRNKFKFLLLQQPRQVSYPRLSRSRDGTASAARGCRTLSHGTDSIPGNRQRALWGAEKQT
jgi:hypothetical protein